MSEKYRRLKTKLEELFQLDKPELDFGLYRIMHARAEEVSRFLDHDLLPQVREAFAQYMPADRTEVERELERVISGVRAGGFDPEESPKVRELRARLADEAVDIEALESEVYDHLLRFFRRYYSDGDFLSRRVYKEGVYAVPYEGEEVTLHWANKDQYYIKTSEYLRDYAFRLRPDDEANPMRVHFRLVDAEEGEHGNVKEAQGKDRVFVLAPGGNSGRDFVAAVDGPEGRELLLRFEYRAATMGDWPPEEREAEEERVKNPKPPKQDDLRRMAVERVLALSDPELTPWMAELARPHRLSGGEEADYSRLEAHLRRYTARNTFDYFIHKDLGGFLRRELDFYIKNEVMHLDDIESESVPRVEQYLSKIKVIRGIAGKLIDFLAQLEDFQKRLWLKKKFVVETSWCIRLGCIPEAFLPEIAANEGQRREWVELHGIDALGGAQGDLTLPEYSEPLSDAFLRAHPTLMVDSRHFPGDFTARLLDAIGDLDEKTDGVLLHSENFQALSLMQARYRERIKCVYIDPPYNTGADDFSFKDTYQHSSWLAMIDERAKASRRLLNSVAASFITIDDTEQPRLRQLLDESSALGGFLANLIWKKRSSPDARSTIGSTHDHLLCYVRDPKRPKDCIGKMPLTERRRATYQNPDNDPRGPWASVDMTGMVGRATSEQFFEVTLPSGRTIGPPQGRSWGVAPATFAAMRQDNRIWFGDSGDNVPRMKKFLSESDGQAVPTLWDTEEAGTNDAGSSEVASLFGTSSVFQSPKPTLLIKRILGIAAVERGATVLDYFAGSGTTGHAVINLNREDGGRRKFILVEMGDYFDTVLLPRLKKVTFTPEWRDGRPNRLATEGEADRSPRIMKVVRLESYEDALNNLELRRTEDQQDLLDHPEAQGPGGLREDYLLRYMLEVESRESPSLLTVSAFDDPEGYQLRVKRPGSDESRIASVDLVETFNWLIGLRVQHLAAPQALATDFTRDSEGRLRIEGRVRLDAGGAWRIRTASGELPDGRRALVIWRRLTGDPERDNLVLDEWFTKQGYSSRDSEFDVIYVNGGNNLENLRAPDETWKVRLIEEDFHRLMFAEEGG